MKIKLSQCELSPRIVVSGWKPFVEERSRGDLEMLFLSMNDMSYPSSVNRWKKLMAVANDHENSTTCHLKVSEKHWGGVFTVSPGMAFLSKLIFSRNGLRMSNRWGLSCGMATPTCRSRCSFLSRDGASGCSSGKTNL